MAIATATAIGLGLAAAGTGVKAVVDANAQSNAQEANDRNALQQIEESRAIRAQATQYAQATPQELAQMNQLSSQALNTYNQQLTALSADREILNAIDPAIKAAGEETLKLLKGEESRVLAPLQRQRDQQREQLKSRLREQLGSGFETSAAGFGALSQFDQQTADLVQTTQQNTIGSLMGLTSQAAASRIDVSGRLGQAGSLYQNTLGNVLTGNQNIQNRLVNATSGNPTNFAGANAAAQMNTALAQNNPVSNAVSNATGNLGSVLINNDYQNRQLDMINKLYNQRQATVNVTPTLGAALPGNYYEA